MHKKLAAALTAASLTLTAAAQAGQAANVRMATLAPKASPWGKVFTAWGKAVSEKTNGAVEVQWLWNGTAGPESSMVGKIKSGQITGAAITAVGLSAIHKP